MSANRYGIIALTGRAHWQRQVAFFFGNWFQNVDLDSESKSEIRLARTAHL